MTLIKEKQNKPKIQSVNRCIKPVHLCIYKVRDHLCTCYILSHSRFISRSLGGGMSVESLHPFWSRKPKSTLRGHLVDAAHLDRWTGRCVKTVVCLNTRCFEDWLWSCCFWQQQWQQEATVFQVLLKVSAQLELYYTTWSWVRFVELSGPCPGSTSHCSSIQRYLYFI